MLTKSKCRCCCLWSSRKVSLEESKNVNLELSREAIHFSNTSRKLLAQAIVLSSKNWRNMNKAAVRWKERNELNDEQPLWPPPPPPLHPHCPPVEGTSLISQEKWSLRSLLSFNGDIWWMGGWMDASDENLRSRLQTGAMHCPGLPWKPLYMSNLLLCPDLTTP